MKKCFKCECVKPLSDFYKHKMMSDGHLNKCKECTKKDVKVNRSEKVEYYREYDRERGNRQGKEYVSEYRSRFPRKYAAHTAVNNAVRMGVLVPQPCEICSADKDVHAHHDDYSQQLDVRWLCPVCHKKWHTENGEGKNG